MERIHDASGESHIYHHLAIAREIVQTQCQCLIRAVGRKVNPPDLKLIRTVALVGDRVLWSGIEDAICRHDEHKFSNGQPVSHRSCLIDDVRHANPLRQRVERLHSVVLYPSSPSPSSFLPGENPRVHLEKATITDVLKLSSVSYGL